MINRRGFLSSILALGAAPAIVRADSLMRIVSRDTTVVRFGGESLLFDGGLGRYVGVVLHDKIAGDGVWRIHNFRGTPPLAITSDWRRALESHQLPCTSSHSSRMPPS